MMRMFSNSLRRFARREDGSVTMIEFIIIIPLVFSAFLMSVEMGVYSMRQMFLDRGLDITVRYVRLNTDVELEHDDLKDMICQAAGFLPDCRQTLRLEMTPVSMRGFSGFGGSADCVDISQPVEPSEGVVLGKEHQLMILRACYKFKPVYKSTGLGREFEKDGSGRAKMISVAAFVQEPG